MKIDQLIHVGYILKPHGVYGVLKFISKYEFPADFQEINALFLGQADDTLPYIIENVEQIAPKQYLVKFEDVDKKDIADKLSKKQVYITSEQFKQWINTDNLPHDYGYLIGYDLLNQERQLIGAVEDIMALPEQYLAQLIVNGREILVPLQEDLIIEINTKKHYIQVDIPDGLIEMYFEP
jgi:16S rRNA processing protein RimM